MTLENLDDRRLLALLATSLQETGIVDSHSNPSVITGSLETDGGDADGGGTGGGFDPNMAIVNGTPTSAFPSVGIVGDASGGFCSGTLIAPQVVLTAGHCGEGVGNTAGRFQVGGTTYATSQVVVHPQYNDAAIGTDNANDIAIFRLNRAVTGVVPSPIHRATPQVGQLLTLVGFGAGGTGNAGHDGSFGTKRVGTTPIDQVSSKLIHWRFDNNNESNTAPGDSGGPAFVQMGGVYQVAGVTSGGEQENSGIGDQSYDTRVDAFQSWIDTFLGATSVPTVSIVASDATAAETTSSQAVNRGSVTITRDGATTTPLTIGLSVGGTATNGADYAPITSNVTIPAGQSSVVVTISPIDDSLTEGNESATFTVNGGTGFVVNSSQGSATVQIADNEIATSNDMFANRVNLSGSVVRTSGSNRTATRETGEPSNAGIRGGRSVWWTWTAPSTGSATITTDGSSFDTTLGVYTGTSIAGLRHVASNDDRDYNRGIYTSQIVFPTVAGRTYQIMVDGYYGDSGSIQLGINLSAARTSVPMGVPTGASHFADQVDKVFEAEEMVERIEGSWTEWTTCVSDRHDTDSKWVGMERSKVGASNRWQAQSPRFFARYDSVQDF